MRSTGRYRGAEERPRRHLDDDQSAQPDHFEQHPYANLPGAVVLLGGKAMDFGFDPPVPFPGMHLLLRSIKPFPIEHGRAAAEGAKRITTSSEGAARMVE
jgi:hypothetical protein